MSGGSVTSCSSMTCVQFLSVAHITNYYTSFSPMQAHLTNECEEVLVTCPNEGCNDKCTRKDVSNLN